MINLTSSHSDQSKQLAGKTNSLASMLFANNMSDATGTQDASFLQLLQNSLPGMTSEQLAALMAGQTTTNTTVSTVVDASDDASQSDAANVSEGVDATLASMMAALLGAGHRIQINNAADDHQFSGDSTANSSDEQAISALNPEANTAAVSFGAADVAVDDLQSAAGLLGKTEHSNTESAKSDFGSQLLSHLQEVKGHQHIQTTEVTSTNAAANTMSVDVPVGDDAWANAMSQRVLMMAGKDMQSAELQLNPPSLGPVSVRLDIQNREASVTFSSPHLAVREAIQSAAPQLIEMFSGSGVNLGNVNVGSQQQPDQRQAQGRGENKGTRSIGGVGEVVQGSGEGATTTVVASRQIGIDGLAVDTFI